jgi:hypothetical protein
MSQSHGHSAAGRIISMKNSSDTIGNQTRDLPTCSAVPQPNALPRAPNMYVYFFVFTNKWTLHSFIRIYYCNKSLILNINSCNYLFLTSLPQSSSEMAHESGKVVSPTHRPPLPPRKYSWYSYLLEDESTPGPGCGRKGYINEKFQWHHWESNPRPSDL